MILLFLAGLPIRFESFLYERKGCENPSIKNQTTSNAVWVSPGIRFKLLMVLCITTMKKIYFPIVRVYNIPIPLMPKKEFPLANLLGWVIAIFIDAIKLTTSQ